MTARETFTYPNHLPILHDERGNEVAIHVGLVPEGY